MVRGKTNRRFQGQEGLSAIRPRPSTSDCDTASLLWLLGQSNLVQGCTRLALSYVPCSSPI